MRRRWRKKRAILNDDDDVAKDENENDIGDNYDYDDHEEKEEYAHDSNNDDVK